MKSILVPFAAIWLAVSPPQAQSHPAWPPVMPYGVIKGVVRNAHSDQPLPYVNIMLVSTTTGAMSRGDGSFAMWFVPAGTYTVKAMAMEHKGATHAGVVVKMGEITELSIALEERWPESETGARSIVGTETRAVGADLVCEIIPLSDTLRVGDFAAFEVILHNVSQETFYLVPSIDGSFEHLRYPMITMSMEGDLVPMTSTQPRMCGNVNPLEPKDFVFLPPGGSFVPFDVYEFDHPLGRAGEHKVSFSYSTIEADYKFWIDRFAGPSIHPRAHELLKRVPRIKLERSITIAVLE